MYNLLNQAATGFDWSTVNLKPVTDQFFSAVPIVIGVVITFIAFRKAWGFVVSSLRRG